MNNDHTYNAVTDRIARLRDSLGQMHPIIPASEIIARSRRRRVRRRLISGTTGVLALAAGAAVAVTALLPASHPASHQRSHPADAQLAAWTVTKEANGTVVIIIREFRDPAALQRRLRADGIPASVVFYPGRLPAGLSPLRIVQFKGNPCQEYSGGENQAQNVVTGRPWHEIVHPSAIPSGAGVQWVASRNIGYYPLSLLRPGQRSKDGPAALLEWLVQPSRQCTGS